MRGSGIGLCSNTITTECTVQKEHDTTKKKKKENAKWKIIRKRKAQRTHAQTKTNWRATHKQIALIGWLMKFSGAIRALGLSGFPRKSNSLGNRAETNRAQQENQMVQIGEEGEKNA